MLLAGTKPMAMFSQDARLHRDDVGDSEFQPHVDSGELIYRALHYPELDFTTHYYAPPHQEWRIKAIDALKRSHPTDGEFKAFDQDDYYRMVGFLLGYNETDIEFFVQRARERRSGPSVL